MQILGFCTGCGFWFNVEFWWSFWCPNYVHIVYAPWGIAW